MGIKRIFLGSIFLLSQFVAEASVFDILRTTPIEKRVALARELYKKEFRRADSVTAFNGFEQLFAVARELKDKPLECSVYDLHADYFSVNRGFNDRSPRYHQKAIDLAIHYNLPIETAIHTHKKGLFYNTFKRYVEANRYLLEAYDLFKIAGFENVPQVGNYLHDLSIFYYTIGDLENAHNFIQQAFQYKSTIPDKELTMTNTLALTLQGLGKESEALENFTKALDLAKTLKDSIWIGIISSNIGSIHFKREQYDKAIPYFTTGYNESLRYGDFRIAAEAIIFLAKCNLVKGNTATAVQQLTLAEPLVRKVNVIDRWIIFYEAMAQLSERKRETSAALMYWKEYDKAKDSLDIIKNLAAVNRVKLQWEMDKHRAQVDQLRSEAKVEVFKRNALIAVLFLLMVISVLTYNRQLLKRRKDKELFEKQEALLQSEKARAEEDLRNATHALERFTENLKHKNELIEEFKTEIEHLQHQLIYPADKERIEYLEKLMQVHIMTDENWDEFKKLFEKVHNGFLFRLKERFIFVTETDIRLFTLIKLGLNNREMSNMLGVTTEAIKKSRQRLRKKINLHEDQSIEEVVATI